ncbi:uracil DNA glycosylase superfamily protein [Asticcacaulis biprosthecium C19]|uniref:Type-5 uracil-DNA glycosylase n=1 Tax=Asticcacaulis biprosthecium C19 TaxID=715226 RepID=F4QR09_9CAUL|nr:uracil-DNA glycosylase [Asticcacaulis biprosthecium]EGF90646.1 uracil DNA glycosylase superfamily protein [Asticcacaulis biprosthecium C19]
MSIRDSDCRLCPRLVDYRDSNRSTEPTWHNAPAPPFGDRNGRLLIVGLAPGRTGANRTGRVFTGDAAGRMLFETLIATGFASGTYRDDGHDDVVLRDCLVTNAVLCAPPGNKPLPAEETTCRPHLAALIKSMPRLKVIVTLGDVARRNLLKALGKPGSAMTGGHGATAEFDGVRVINSFHCSRLNLNTGRLTASMFAAVFETAGSVIRQPETKNEEHRKH